VLFAGASIVCGLAPNFALLLTARCLQAVGGALILGAALAILTERTGSHARGLAVWGTAGILGAAIGPAIGGILTQALGWESIFFTQAPIPLLALSAVTGVVAGTSAPVGRPHVAANLALLLMSAALSGALFLLAVLLINGWRLSPAAAGAVLSAMPLAAVVAGYWAKRLGSGTARAVPGVILITGGLAALALLPGASWTWTLLPQLAIGAGLGLAISALTDWALHGRDQQAVHGGWTIAARHGGVVLGLTAGTAAVIESGVRPSEKLVVAENVLSVIDQAEGQVPEVRAPLERLARGSSNPAAFDRLATNLEDELARAATSAFSRSFWIAALFGLLAAVVIWLRRREVPE
jgi:MFS family permease